MKKIIISGGNFVNKGAEAMIYIAVNECLSRFDDCKCILQLAEGFIKINSLNELFDISEGKTKIEDLLDTSCKSSKIKKIKELIYNYKKADILIDVSGYELSSKLGFYQSLRYLFKIWIAKRNKVKVLLMPQSYGPFNYGGLKQLVMNILLKSIMNYPYICYAREEEGKKELEKKIYNVKTIKSCDLVLQNKKIDEVYKKHNYNLKFDIDYNSVAVIPNMRLSEQYNSEIAMKYYYTAIDCLRKKDNVVYLIAHSNGDLNICNIIKERYEKDNGVIVINKVLSCYQYQEFSKHMKYIIASRYHSIVHAYKEHIPAILLGWAIKYRELARHLNQEKYVVDVSENNPEILLYLISNMEKSFKEESKNIEDKLSIIQKENCFDILDEVGS